MLIPMLLGYFVGAVGIYTLLYKVSPVVTDDYAAQTNASEAGERVEVIELFPAGLPADHIKAA